MDALKNSIFGLGIGLLVAACSGVPVKPVADADRDSSGNYDGLWLGVIEKTPARQRHLEWTMQCYDRSGEIYLEVKEGVVYMPTEEDPWATNIATDGKFLFKINMDEKATSSLTSDVHMRSDLSILLGGDLSEASRNGSLVFGIAQLGNRGCTSKIRFERTQRSQTT